MLFEKITADRMVALKSGDRLKNSLLSTLIGEIQNKTKAGKEEVAATDELVMGIIKKFIKSAEQSIEIVNNAGLTAEQERAELAILVDYMPKMMTEEETHDAVRIAITTTMATSVKDIGKVMGYLKKEHGQTLNMGIASKIVKEALA
jgi:uncharacterized protein YqeY